MLVIATATIPLAAAALLGGVWLAAALAAFAVAALLAATWTVGWRTWPRSEVGVGRRLGTAPADIEASVAKGDPAAPLRIGVLGDIQNGISELADVLDAMRAAHVDFVLQLGDAANAGLPGRYAVLRRMFETHAPGIPVIAVPGNHDVGREWRHDVWRAWVGRPAWRLDVRGWRLVGLDDASGAVSAESMDLLAAVAREPPAACGTILIAHRPLAAPSDAGARDVPATGRGRSPRWASCRR